MRTEVPAVVDLERAPGDWVRVCAVLVEPEPAVGALGPQISSLLATTDDGELVELTTDEVALLAPRFEQAYYRWRRRERG